jgi:hypothetical protein
MEDNVMDGACLLAGNLYKPVQTFRKPEARKQLGSKLRKSEHVMFKK